MRYPSVYNSHNVIAMVAVFCIIFFLGYAIASSWHEGRRIAQEIQKIEETNESLRQQIVQKEKELEYLMTPERIEKEAKIQMGKKRPGEQVLVFIEESVPLVAPEIILESNLPSEQKAEALRALPIYQRWLYRLRLERFIPS